MPVEIETVESYAEAPPVPKVTGQPCGDCGLPTPFAQLEPSLVNSKRLVCPACRELSKAQKIEARQEKAARERSQKTVEMSERFVCLARRADEDAAPTIHAAINAILDEAGGMEKFASRFWGILEELYVAGGSRQTILNTMTRFMGLIAEATPKVRRDFNYRELSDQELAVTYRLATERAFAVKAAERGYARWTDMETLLEESDREALAKADSGEGADG